MVDEAQFRKNLRIVRAARGLTGDELSKAAKLKSQKRAIDIEEGRVKCSLYEAISICHALTVPLEEMLTKKVVVKFTYE